jgi:hypothetical protein
MGGRTGHRHLWNRFPRTAAAQKTFKGENWAITFASSNWDTLNSANILGKFKGLYGMATLDAHPGTSVPNLDSMAKSYSDSLGGHITKDSSGSKTLGGYTVHWQQFKYDSLPKLSALITEEIGFTVTLQDGSFRVYYLQSDGFVFTLALMSVVPSAAPPYPEVEVAIATLKLGGQIGIIPVARFAGRDLWIKNGKLGGTWLKSNRVFAVECFDARGSVIGNATHAAEGTWSLPVSRQDMFVLLRTADGANLHFLVRP